MTTINQITTDQSSREYLARKNMTVERDTLSACIKLATLTALGIFILFALSITPYIAIFIIDFLFCAYLSRLFKNKYRYLFLIHPFFLFISSRFYSSSFLLGGDGQAYLDIVQTYFNSNNLSFHFAELSNEMSIFEFFKYTSLGILPVFAVPEFFFGKPNDVIYYLWQGTFNVFLSLIVITLARAWRTLQTNYLFAMALFVVISPSCFDLGAAPTRHVMTLFGVLLLFNAHIAISQNLTLSRAISYIIAIAVILISKAPLLLPYVLFTCVDIFFIHKKRISRLKLFMLLGVLALGLSLIGRFLLETLISSEASSVEGANTFGSNTQIPIIGWIVKYIYAILSPFPWSSFMVFINSEAYQGNGVLFFMHILSSLTGLYLFFIVILKYRYILNADIQLQQAVAYALIMSLSILRGSTGFHVYLLIYFPMLAPLLTVKKLQINLFLPVLFVLTLEGVVLFGREVFGITQ